MAFLLEPNWRGRFLELLRRVSPFASGVIRLAVPTDSLHDNQLLSSRRLHLVARRLNRGRCIMVKRVGLALAAGLISVGWVTCRGAQQMKHSQLVGFTATTVTKDTDVIRMTNLCQTEVESEARICNSAEVTEAVSVTQSSPARQSAWVRRASSPNSTADVSVAIITNSDRKIRLICDGSPPPTNFQELTISDLLSLQECDSPHAIACCAPTTVPEPTKSQ